MSRAVSSLLHALAPKTFHRFERGIYCRRCGDLVQELNR